MSKAIKALAKKRTVFAPRWHSTIFGAVYGFAATFNVGTNVLERRQRDRRVLPGDRHPDRHLHGRRTTRRSPATRSRRSSSTGIDDTNCDGKAIP